MSDAEDEWRPWKDDYGPHEDAPGRIIVNVTTISELFRKNDDSKQNIDVENEELGLVSRIDGLHEVVEMEGRQAETLRQKQSRFAAAVPTLIAKAIELGYEVTLGDAFRDPRVFGEMGDFKGYGQASSCHKLKLAIDLNLYKNGTYLDDTESHRQLGEWWESQGEGYCWGGRFKDGNHYSFEHNGFK